jgi:hypothetical protein
MRVEWVASTTSHYLGTWCIQYYYRRCAHLGCQQSTELTPLPADLNGLVRFAERPNLVSAHVPSRFKRALRNVRTCVYEQYGTGIIPELVHGSRGLSQASQIGSPGCVPVKSMWRTKWRWDSFAPVRQFFSGQRHSTMFLAHSVICHRHYITSPIKSVIKLRN